jgi:hypothetical protein
MAAHFHSIAKHCPVMGLASEETHLSEITYTLRALKERYPKYAGISGDQIYKLFIDANKWAVAEADLKEFCFDRKEPGYMQAMMNSFFHALLERDPREPLSAKAIVELHDLTVTHVTEENGCALELGLRKPRGRQDSEKFGLVESSTLSRAGFAELLQKRKDPRYNVQFGEDTEPENLFVVLMQNPSRTIRFEGDLPSSPSPHRDRKPFTPFKRTTTPLDDVGFADNLIALFIATSATSSTSPVSTLQGKSPSPEIDSMTKELIDVQHLPLRRNALSEEAMSVPSNTSFRPFSDSARTSRESPCITLMEPRREGFLETAIDHLIELYNRSGKTTRDKLLLMQNLDQIHPFYDANIRTFVILLSHLLFSGENDIPPCFDDPNCFDCLSLDELEALTEKGKENFRTLANLR